MDNNDLPHLLLCKDVFDTLNDVETFLHKLEVTPTISQTFSESAYNAAAHIVIMKMELIEHLNSLA